MKKEKKTLLKDIANTTGFSLSAVSRAINGGGYVKEDKKKIIINEAIKREYFKDILDNISIFSKLLVIVPFTTIASTVKGYSSFYQDILDNINDESEKLDIPIEFISLDDNKSLKRLMQSTKVRNVDGIIAVGFSIDHVKILEKAIKKPTMLVNSQIYSANFNTISPDNRAIGYQCIEHLLINGHTNILHITNDNRKTIRDRLIGFKDALLDYHIAFHDHNVLNIPVGKISIDNLELEQNIINIIKQHKITAIFSSTDSISISLLDILKKNNFSIPNDISLISINNTKISKFSHPPLTTYELPKKEIALHAIQHLIYHKVLLRKTTLQAQLYGTLIERGSVKNIS